MSTIPAHLMSMDDLRVSVDAHDPESPYILDMEGWLVDPEGVFTEELSDPKERFFRVDVLRVYHVNGGYVSPQEAVIVFGDSEGVLDNDITVAELADKGLPDLSGDIRILGIAVEAEWIRE